MRTGKYTTILIRRHWKLLHDNAKEIIREILGEHVTFGKHFNGVFNNLKESRQKEMIEWVKECKEGNNIALSSDKIKGLLAFVLRFRNTNFRAILTKKKNGYFIALFLDKHKYYENERRKLGV